MTTYSGTSGNDTLTGSTGDDTLNGGKGNDGLDGRFGNDLYTFSKGDGIDTIYEYNTTTGTIDTVQFLDVKSTEITAIYSRGSDLILQYGAADQLTISEYFSPLTSKIELFNFSDGITWDQATLKAQVFTYTGTADTNWIYGRHDSSNIIYGLAGNDSLQGGMKADRIEGGTGNDILQGSGSPLPFEADGNDTLNGGTGNDTLYGGTGNDLYTFSKGDGLDTIFDPDSTLGTTDTVQFLDVKSTEITAIERLGYNLVLKYGTADQFTISNYYPWGNIELFKFSDGITWDKTALMAQEFTVTGTANNDFIAGSNNTRNHISGLDGNDTLYGAAMNDRLDGGAGNDVLMGFAGNDTLNGGTGSDFFDGGTGDDLYTFARGDGVDTLYAYDATTSDIDTVQFLDVKSTEITAIEHQIDNDNLVLRYGTADQLTLGYYFKNFDIEQFKFSDGVTWDGAGLKAQVLTLTGTAGNDSISGHQEGGNRIFGLDGNDYLSGSGRMGNYVDGGNGDDTLTGGAAGNDTLSGNAGDDSLSGGGSGDGTLNGGTGHDDLSGGSGDDTLNGGTGNDTLSGSTGNDLYTFARGDGMDTLNDFGGTTVSDIDTVQFLDVKSTEITSIDYQDIAYQYSHLVVNYSTADRLTLVYYTSNLDIEQFKFSDGITWDAAGFMAQTFTYTGTEGDDSISGHSEGGNLIAGLGGNDSLNGGAMADSLNGGTGNDSLTGGDGNDTYYVDSSLDVVSETNALASTGGIDRVNSYLAAYTLGTNVENGRVLATGTASLTGNGLNNTLYAGAGSNALNGGAGTDTVSYNYATAGVTASLGTTAAQATVGSGSDTLKNIENLVGSRYADRLTGSAGGNALSGGSGNDRLNGGAGNDTLSGSADNDVLTGGLGADKLTGGTGADHFDFNTLSELALSSATRDTITDFKTSDADKIDLLGVDANTALAGNQAFNFLGAVSAFTGNATAQLRFDAAAHILYGSTNADTAAEFAIVLTGVSSLSGTDLVL